MNKNEQRQHRILLLSLVASAILVVTLITFTFHRSTSAKAIRIHFDSKGGARLGPIPLQNEKVRGLVLAGVHRVYPNTPFELAASDGAPFTNVVAVLTSLATAGVPLCTMVTQPRSLAATTNSPAAR